jgi:hypothetical protein
MLGAALSGLAAQARLVAGDFSGSFDAKGVPALWELVKHVGTPDVRALRDGAIASVAMRSDKASFALQRQLSIDLSSHPMLAWKWRVDELPLGGDFRSSRTDDQAAQLYVIFSRTRAIAYLWDTSAGAGTVGDAAGVPPFTRVKVMVLRSGKAEAGLWLNEERNLAEDYRRLFGEEAPGSKAIGIRLQINSQHTGSEAACAFADIVFEGAGKQR